MTVNSEYHYLGSIYHRFRHIVVVSNYSRILITVYFVIYIKRLDSVCTVQAPQWPCATFATSGKRIDRQL